MSRRHDVQDGTGIIERYPPVGNLQVYGAGPPTNGQAGFVPGCTYQNISATLAGTFLYVNTGTSTSSVWTPIAVTFGSPLLAIPAATTTLTLTPSLHAGKWLEIAPTGGLAITPPAATGTGNTYRFYCTAAITGGSFTFDAKAGNASDVLYGWIQTNKAGTFTPYANASNTNLLTLNGTTTGGAAIGDWFEVQDMATNQWKLTGFFTQSGTIATPLSNH